MWACSWFGIDSPYPSINQKLFLFGNSKLLPEIISKGVDSIDTQRVIFDQHFTIEVK